MRKKEDRRIVKTRRALREALLDLIEEKGLDRVTVKELCERANLNRGTFYLHYRDVYDLLEQYTDDVLAGFQDIVSRPSTLGTCCAMRRRGSRIPGLSEPWSTFVIMPAFFGS